MLSKLHEAATRGFGSSLNSRIGTARVRRNSPEREPHPPLSRSNARPFDLGSIARPAEDRDVPWNSRRSSQGAVNFNPGHPESALIANPHASSRIGSLLFVQLGLTASAGPKARKQEAPTREAGDPYSSFPAARSRISPRSAARKSYPGRSSSLVQRTC